MKKSKLPQSDSIQELAQFWDTHELTEFDDKLEEVTGPVFARKTSIKVPLESREAKLVEKLAKTKGVTQEELVREWVLKMVAQCLPNRRTKVRS